MTEIWKFPPFIFATVLVTRMGNIFLNTKYIVCYIVVGFGLDCWRLVVLTVNVITLWRLTHISMNTHNIKISLVVSQNSCERCTIKHHWKLGQMTENNNICFKQLQLNASYTTWLWTKVQ